MELNIKEIKNNDAPGRTQELAQDTTVSLASCPTLGSDTGSGTFNGAARSGQGHGPAARPGHRAPRPGLAPTRPRRADLPKTHPFCPLLL